MCISAFCKIWELNTECEIVFVLTSVDSQGSQMGSQLLQNTETIKQTDALVLENLKKIRICLVFI